MARLVEQSGGNPLHLEGLLGARRDADGADLPESLEAVIGTQIDALRPLPRRVLRFASVLGTTMRLSSLESFLADDALRIDLATREDLNRFMEPEEPDRIRFRHAVVRDAAYGGLSFARRRQLHARAAAITREGAGDDPDGVADMLSLHYFLAQEYPEAWTYARHRRRSGPGHRGQHGRGDPLRTGARRGPTAGHGRARRARRDLDPPR